MTSRESPARHFRPEVFMPPGLFFLGGNSFQTQSAAPAGSRGDRPDSVRPLPPLSSAAPHGRRSFSTFLRTRQARPASILFRLRPENVFSARKLPPVHSFSLSEIPCQPTEQSHSLPPGAPLRHLPAFFRETALSALRFPVNGSNVWAPLRLYYAGTSCLRTGNVWKRFFLPFCSWLSARFLPVSSPCGR